MGAAIGSIFGIIFVIFGILTILSGVWCDKKGGWAWVGLIIGLLTFLVPYGGFYIGPFLAIIGAALAMKKGK